MAIRITDPDTDPYPDPYRDTGKTYLGGGIHCLGASSLANEFESNSAVHDVWLLFIKSHLVNIN